MSITIDRDGAARLLAAHQMTDERPLWHALSRAAAGDFAPLAALVGTREVASVDAPAGELYWQQRARELRVELDRAVSALGDITSGRGAPNPKGIAALRTRVDAVPAPAPDFREGDVVRVAPDNLEAIVTGVPTAFHPHTARIAASDGGLYDARLSDLRVTHRRHFKAGERCGTVAVGQVRGRVPMTYTVGQRIGDDGPRFAIHWSDGPHAPQSAVESQLFADVLAADWSADAAVPCEVRP